MKIWFDIANSPHINMFAALIRDLQQQHEVLITCRPLANTVDLLELHNLPYTVVGKHYGKKLSAKVMGYPVRVMSLARYLHPFKINAAVSQSSFHSPIVAKMLGVKSIYMNDNEHAAGNKPAFLFASRILVPECLRPEQLRGQFANPSKVKRYPGVKEGLYLWELQRRLEHGQSVAATCLRERKNVYVRPEPWTAQYYHAATNFLDELLLGLQRRVNVTLLPRGSAQAQHYRQPQFSDICIVDTALDIAEIAPDCDLFIGAGGTMTREMAVLGIPTISVYQDQLLAVDRYLLEQESYLHRPRLTADEAINYLDTMARRPPNRLLLSKGQAAYKMVRQEILELN